MATHRDAPVVRATPDFCASLDVQHGDERGPRGVGSSADFEADELLSIIEEFATGGEALPEYVPGRAEYRVLIKAGRVVPMVSVFGQLAPDGAVELVDIAIDPRSRGPDLATPDHRAGVDPSRLRLPPRPCQAFLVEPLDGSPLGVGEPVVLRGQGYWLEEDRPELDSLTWSSSLDGDLGHGARLTARLSRGVHTLTLSAGTGERVGTMSVQVLVGVTAAQPSS